MNEIMKEDYFETRFPYDEGKYDIWAEIVAYLSERHGLGDAVLDVGTGYGYFINNVNATERYALDLNRYPLDRIDGGVHRLQGDATAIPFPDGVLETVFASNVLEHLPSSDTVLDALTEYRRVLTGDGRLIVITPNFRLAPRQYFDDYTHDTIITDRSLADMLRTAGFEILDRDVRFLPFSAEGRLPAWPVLTRLYLRLPVSPFAGQSLFVASARPEP